MGQYLLKNTMTKGELSPLVRGRRDLELYQAGLLKCLNWVILKHGGARRRSGTRFVGQSTDSGERSSLFEYTFNTDQSYILEFSNLKLRVWTDGGVVLSGASPLVVTTPYTSAHIDTLSLAPYNDVNYLAGPSSVQSRRLKRLDHDAWVLEPVAFEDGPYLPINDIASRTVAWNGTLTTGTVRTFTWSTSQGFTSDHVGRVVRVQTGGVWSWGTITAVSNASTASVLIGLGNGAAIGSSASWRLGAYYGNNWPRAVSFFDSRLVWANAPSHPRSLGISKADLPTVYSPSNTAGTVASDAGMFLDIIAGRADPILWLSEGYRLLLGTASAIRSIGAGDASEAMTPLNVTQRREVNDGANGVLPARVGSSSIFASRTGRAVHDLFFDYAVNGLISPDVSVLSEHLFKRGIVKFAWQGVPTSTLWALTKDGLLHGLTIDKQEKVLGYHTHDVGGFIESIAVLSAPDEDQLWLSVRRTVNGATVRYMEVLQPPFDGDIQDLSDAFLVDCGVTYSGAPASTISGLDHLEGEEVDILGDGVVFPRTTVVGGAVTIPNGRKVSVAQIGLPITNLLATLPAPAQAPDGSAMGRRKRASEVIVDVLDTRGLKVRETGSPSSEELQYRLADTAMGQPSALLDGTFSVKVDGTWDGEAQIEFSVDDPLPATVLAINVNIVSEP